MQQLDRLRADPGAARPAVILPARTLKPAHFPDRVGELLKLLCQRAQAEANPESVVTVGHLKTT